MAADTSHGSPQFPTVAGMVSTQAELDAAVQAVRSQKDAWLAVSVRERILLLDRLLRDFAALMPRWVEESCRAKGAGENASIVSDEWAAGTWPVLKNLRQLRQTLRDIVSSGHPHIPGPVTTRSDGQVVAQVFPQDMYDRLFLRGVTAEVWMQPGVTAEQLPQTQALVYRDRPRAGRVALVLGAGNVASIGPMDILYKLFMEDQVVVCKMNPVNAYLGPLLAEAFRVLVEPGYLRIVYGGAAEGAYLCQHADVDEIHITGSDKTFDAIVFGTGSEGAARKAARQPLLHKRVTGELGNVSPLIVVPGPWQTSDIAYQAEHIASMLTNNAGFNCNATRVIIQHEQWGLRDQLRQQIGRVLQNVPARAAYYPGAQQRQQAFVAAHPEAEQFGSVDAGQLPWTFISDVDATNTEDICFTTEAFCGLFAETALSAASVVDYIEQAVTFANERLWGTLCATILVHPHSLRDPQIAAALDRALAQLRYGTIGVNYWAGTGFAMAVTTWGAFPGHELYDIQSGNGVVHNTLMFARPQKSVIRAPFRSVPTPPWFATQGKIGRSVFSRLARLEAEPSPWKIPGIIWSALSG